MLNGRLWWKADRLLRILGLRGVSRCGVRLADSSFAPFHPPEHRDNCSYNPKLDRRLPRDQREAASQPIT